MRRHCSCQYCTNDAQCQRSGVTAAVYQVCPKYVSLQYLTPCMYSQLRHLLSCRQVCRPSTDPDQNSTRTCGIKGLFTPFLWQDGVGAILSFAVAVLSSWAGIGGGGLQVPLFFFLGWGKDATHR